MEPLLDQLPHQLLHGHPSSAQALTSMRESLLTSRCEEARENLLKSHVKTYERPRAPNFSAGPGALFEDVLRKAQRDMLDFAGTGVSVMEMSHRHEDGPVQTFMSELQLNMKELLNIPENYEVLFFPGGATAQYSAVPLNICKEGDTVDFINTGVWSEKAMAEASKYVKVNVAYDAGADDHLRIAPVAEWKLSEDGKYVHIVINETMSGLEFLEDPDLHGRILVADATSSLLSRPIDISKYGIIYTSGGKNLGPTGVCMVIIRKDLIGHARDITPGIMNYELMAKANPIQNLMNTPPVWNIYMVHLMTEYYIENFQGGLDEIKERAMFRSDLVYEVIDNSNGFYTNHIEQGSRSRMNAVFRIDGGSEKGKFLEKHFVDTAEASGLYQMLSLNSFSKSMHGLRITMYNTVTDEALDAVLEFMKVFQAENLQHIQH